MALESAIGGVVAADGVVVGGVVVDGLVLDGGGVVVAFTAPALESAMAPPFALLVSLLVQAPSSTSAATAMGNLVMESLAVS